MSLPIAWIDPQLTCVVLATQVTLPITQWIDHDGELTTVREEAVIVVIQGQDFVYPVEIRGHNLHPVFH